MDQSALGHRQRLRTRFLNAGVNGLQDYEILEMILFAAHPRGDVKPLAKQLLARFKSLNALLRAEVSELKTIKGLGEASIASLKVVEVAAQALWQEKLQDRSLLTSFDHVVDYCKSTMGHLKKEQVRLLFLDHHNRLIHEDLQNEGTVNQVALYTREVVEKALHAGASNLIIVHNHPSGDPTPSKEDIQLTRDIKNAVEAIGITLHDHLIIGRDNAVSLRAAGLL
jgi:DNA repair protein RadC